MPKSRTSEKLMELWQDLTNGAPSDSLRFIFCRNLIMITNLYCIGSRPAKGELLYNTHTDS